MTTWYCVTVVAEEFKSTLWWDDQVVAVITAKSIGTARNGGKYVIRVHGTQNEMRAVPASATVLAIER